MSGPSCRSASFDFAAASRNWPHSSVPTFGISLSIMLSRARANAAKLGAANVEFRKGQIEQLPVDDNSIDLIISNCVINLSPDKPAVFREIFRVLKPGGHFAVSDIVLLAALPEHIRRDVSAYVGCVSGAELLHDYVRTALDAGLEDITIPNIAHELTLQG